MQIYLQENIQQCVNSLYKSLMDFGAIEKTVIIRVDGEIDIFLSVIYLFYNNCVLLIYLMIRKDSIYTL